MDTEKLKVIFDKFAGREVSTIAYKDTPPKPDFNPTAKIDPQDPAITELRTAVEAVGCTLRIWLPGTIGTMDLRPNRVNVHVSPDDSGVYRIGRFKMG